MDVTPGRVWVNGETVTPAKLHSHVDDANVSNGLEADLAADMYMVRVSKPVSPVVGQPFYQSSRSQVEWNDGNRDQSMFLHWVYATCAQSTISPGHLCVWSTLAGQAGRVVRSDFGDVSRVAGISLGFGIAGATFRMAVKGPVIARVRNYTSSDAGLRDYVSGDLGPDSDGVGVVNGELQVSIFAPQSFVNNAGRLLTPIPANSFTAVTAWVKLYR